MLLPWGKQLIADVTSMSEHFELVVECLLFEKDKKQDEKVEKESKKVKTENSEFIICNKFVFTEYYKYHNKLLEKGLKNMFYLIYQKLRRRTVTKVQNLMY